MTVELPAGIQHGTPEGFAAGCRREKDCPALHTHGMCCLFAHVRSQTDPRYFKAKVRDPRPAAIAQRLGIRPPRPAVAAAEEQLDEEAAERSQTEVYQPGRGWHKRPADQQPVKNPEARDSAGTEATDTPPVTHESTNTDPAQPLAEQSQDPDPQEDAGTPAIEDQTPAAETPDVEGEDMGHPTTTEETTMTTTEQPVDEFAARCADAISTAAGRKKIRDWARAQGFVVPSRGKIPALHVRSYVQATYTDADTPTLTNVADEAHEPPVDESAAFDGSITVVEDSSIVVSGTLMTEPDDAFRPDWAGVTIHEDVRAARLTAARLEEDNVRLQAERDEAVAVAREANATLSGHVAELQAALQTAVTAPPPEDGGWVDPLIAVYAAQLATAHNALDLTLRKLAEERNARVTQVADLETQIEKLIQERRILRASKKILSSIIEQAHATITAQARDLRTAQQNAALPFWRRRR